MRQAEDTIGTTTTLVGILMESGGNPGTRKATD